MIALLLVALVATLTVGFCVLVARALWRWQGMWRWALAVPIVLLVGVVLNIVTAIWADPTAHNLWPIELFAWLVLDCLLVGMVYVAHWIANRPSRA